MRKFCVLNLFLYVLILCNNELAQSTIISYTSEDQNATSVVGISVNSTKTISVGTISYHTGSEGRRDFNISNNGCTSNIDSNCWKIELVTGGISTLTVFSKKIRPIADLKDFKLPYKIGSDISYTYVSGGTINVANNFTTSDFTNINLANECNNQSFIILNSLI